MKHRAHRPLFVISVFSVLLLQMPGSFAGISRASSWIDATSTAQDGRSSEEEEGGAGFLNARFRWYLQQRMNANGKLALNSRLLAIEQLEGNIARNLVRSSPGLSPSNVWKSIGPSPLNNGSVNYSGRVTALAVDPANPSIVYLGAAQGGVWKSVDGGATWTPKTDNEVTLAIGSLAIDPSNSQTIYAGTGEANGSGESYFGTGILKSTDAGNTWTLLGNEVFAGSSISKVIVNPQFPGVLWVSNTYGCGGFAADTCYFPPSGSFGVWKSTNGGATWTLVLNAPDHRISIHDLILDPTNASILYAAVDGDGGFYEGVWKTTDGGSTWVRKVTGLPTNFGRMDLAINPQSPSILLAAIGYGDTMFDLYKTTNGGESWFPLPSTSYLCPRQAWYDLTLEGAPDGRFWFGCIELYRSDDGGQSWLNMMNSGQHVDQHAVAFSSLGVWQGNDGGVFFSPNNGGFWVDKNTGLSTIQFYPGASMNPYSVNMALGGTQDNSTARYSGSNVWSLLYGGDGAFTAIDPEDEDYHWFLSTQYLGIVQTHDAGGSYYTATSGLLDANSTSAAAFIAPFALCPRNGITMVAGSDNVWRSESFGGSWSSNSPDPLDEGHVVSAVAFSPFDPDCNTYFVGMVDGRVYRTNVGGGSSGWVSMGGSTLPYGRAISDIEVDPADPDVLYVTLSGYGGPHLYRTEDPWAVVPTWQPIDGGVPDTPALAFLIDPRDPNILYLGTDIGVFRSLDRGNTWEAFMNGLPRVAVYDLVGDALPHAVMAFTHGRGAFLLDASGGSSPREASPAGNMRARKGTGSSVDLDYTPACGATDHAVYMGSGPIQGLASWEAAACGLGASGSASFNLNPPSPGMFKYFVIVGQNLFAEGSYGRTSSLAERPEAVGLGFCDLPQNLGGSCSPPDTTPPTGVGNVAPADGSFGQSLNPTLVAASASDSEGPVSYFFELYRDSSSCTGSPNQTRSYATSSSWKPATLEPGDVAYRWRNKARDAAGNETAFGPCWGFSTQLNLFSDDFEDGIADGWRVVTGSWSVVSDGSKVYKQSNNVGDGWSFTGTAWSDYSLQARVKPVSFNGSDRFASIYVRWQDSSHWYDVTLRNSNTLQLKKNIGGVVTTLASKIFSVSAGTWYTVKLSAVGNLLRVYVNGTLELTTTDNSLTTGGIALGTYQATAEFDDVVVGPPGP